ncbi:hypothetical protein [Dyella terrae]|uniref:hypothetical protein n=1 Tax=Dyella terrae TaxID=522259 RepID=UPI001EFCDB65|nr:hypothetical protein [Dyella terrae]ULU26624.1 hypothetical protein DYST_03570 [Dyella terrae]
MNPLNELLRLATCNVLAAIHVLDEAGATVTDIAVRSARPVITLDGEPKGDQVKGALHKSQTFDQHREHVMVAMISGCRVQWTVRTVRRNAGMAVEA